MFLLLLILTIVDAHIYWGDYISRFSIEIKSDSYQIFKRNLEFIENHNDKYNTNFGSTKYLHLSKENFESFFEQRLETCNYSINEGNINWLEKGLYYSSYNQLKSVLESNIKIRYGIECDISDKVDLLTYLSEVHKFIDNYSHKLTHNVDIYQGPIFANINIIPLEIQFYGGKILSKGNKNINGVIIGIYNDFYIMDILGIIVKVRKNLINCVYSI